MKIRVENQTVDISFEKTELIKEVIKITKERYKCSFDNDLNLYNELTELIEERKKEPIDYSCIE